MTTRPRWAPRPQPPDRPTTAPTYMGTVGPLVQQMAAGRVGALPPTYTDAVARALRAATEAVAGLGRLTTTDGSTRAELGHVLTNLAEAERHTRWALAVRGGDR